MPERPPIYRREAGLVMEVLEFLDAAEVPIDWLELLDRFGGDRNYKTVENVFYDLIAFGAVQKLGGHGHRHRKALRITELGSCWLKGVSPPLVGG